MARHFLGINFPNLKKTDSMGLNGEYGGLYSNNFARAAPIEVSFTAIEVPKEPAAQSPVSQLDRFEARALTAKDRRDRLRHTEMTSKAESN